MHPNIHIRKAQAGDAATIAEFNIAMARETEDKALDRTVIIAGVRCLLENPQYGFYIVAESDGEIAGCLLITYEWSDWRNGLFWWIQSVYIHPAFRRRGIYRRMYGFIKELTQREPQVCGFRLYVDKDNRPARKTYRELGMTQTNYILFEEESV